MLARTTRYGFARGTQVRSAIHFFRCRHVEGTLLGFRCARMEARTNQILEGSQSVPLGSAHRRPGLLSASVNPGLLSAGVNKAEPRNLIEILPKQIAASELTTQWNAAHGAVPLAREYLAPAKLAMTTLFFPW